MTRNILDACPKALQNSLNSQLQALFTAPDPQTARQLLHSILATYGEKAPQAVERLENGFDDAISVLNYPEPYRKRLRTTNIVERLNEEIRRRERVIRIFPNGASVIRLLGALLTEQHEAWSTGRKYFDMAAYWDWRRPQAEAAD
ncbi:MAG: transposase [Thermaerobacter sp.]|nr:transposase [Thermaerobacter sp.]